MDACFLTSNIERLPFSFVAFIVFISPKEATNAIWTYIGSSFGLMIAAIVAAKEGGLTLYQAIEVANLLGYV